MDFKNYLATNAQKINQQLELILSEFLNQAKKTNIKFLPLALAFLSACQGGKRIRGTLVKLGYELAGGRGEITKMAAAIEILHTALLIHDDIIDQSPTRRGQPSLYKALGGDHYGISQAISLGDIGLIWPIKIMADSGFDDQIKITALKHLSQTIISTGWGQALDVEIPHLDEDKKEADMMTMMKLKTATYTVAAPLQLGAILAGAEDKLIRLLGQFGQNLGVAFQIQDDILDGQSDWVDVAYTKALQYVSRAKMVIPKITGDTEMRRLLTEMTDYMVERKK